MASLKTALIAVTVLLAITVFGCSRMTAEQPSIDRQFSEQIARAYGLAHFDRIQVLKYTFNVELNDRFIQRRWVWSPQSGLVTFQGKMPNGEQKQISYNRRNFDFADGSETKQIDRWFINDQYWLLFPFHLNWDKNLTVRLSKNQPLPIPPGNAHRLTVKYPPQGGYTPGDVYELYVRPDNLVAQWVYRKGGSDRPTRITTWEDHVRLGPIIVALSRRNADNTFQLWFSDLTVKAAGDDTWRKPDPIQ